MPSELEAGDIPASYYDPLAATAGVSPPGTPRVQIDWGQPSWLEQAGAQSQINREAFARGGVREMLRNTEGTQELASGFGGGGIAGVTKGAAKGVLRALSDIRRPRENIDTVLQSNFNHGRSVGNDVASVDSLIGGVSKSTTDVGRVKSLAEQISGPAGYWERPIVDDAGNVIEGAHRVAAAQQMGLDSIPVYRVKDLERGLPIDEMRQAIRGSQPTHPDHVHQIMDQVLEMVHEVGSPQAALREYEFPPAFRSRFEAALKAAEMAGGKLKTPAKGAPALADKGAEALHAGDLLPKLGG